MSEILITEELLAALEKEIAGVLSPYRMQHTQGVAAMARRLAALFCPDKECSLVAAALLHDVTKELPDSAQLTLLEKGGVLLREDEQASPKIWHGMTAALVIPERYAAFATPEVISAVRWHTTGRAGLSLFDALVFLADYIEEGRRFAAATELRDRLFRDTPSDPAARLLRLREVLLSALENTLTALKRKGEAICLDTAAAHRYLQENKNPFERNLK